jgi:hypothetical protein
MFRSRTWSQAWACKPLGLNVSGEDAEINVIFDGERNRLRAILPELEERKQWKRASALPAHGLQLHPHPKLALEGAVATPKRGRPGGTARHHSGDV